MSFKSKAHHTAGSFLILVILLFIAGMNATVSAQTPNFDQLKQRFDNGFIFSSQFSHTYTDSYTGETVHSSGKIWIDNISYKLKSDGQTIVVDGETSQVYDPERNRVIIDNYYPDEDDFAPSRMLSGIDSTYAVSEQKAGNKTKITLTTDDDFAVFVRVEIMLDAKQHPLEIQAWDISDNHIVTAFTEGSFLKPETGVFTLQYPANAEVVDMRY
jgi:outer membrane lipoprotein-sorting protein